MLVIQNYISSYLNLSVSDLHYNPYVPESDKIKDEECFCANPWSDEDIGVHHVDPRDRESKVHRVHLKCIREWKKNSNSQLLSCPTCREQIDADSISTPEEQLQAAEAKRLVKWQSRFHLLKIGVCSAGLAAAVVAMKFSEKLLSRITIVAIITLLATEGVWYIVSVRGANEFKQKIKRIFNYMFDASIVGLSLAAIANRTNAEKITAIAAGIIAALLPVSGGLSGVKISLSIALGTLVGLAPVTKSQMISIIEGLALGAIRIVSCCAVIAPILGRRQSYVSAMPYLLADCFNTEGLVESVAKASAKIVAGFATTQFVINMSSWRIGRSFVVIGGAALSFAVATGSKEALAAGASVIEVATKIAMQTAILGGVFGHSTIGNFWRDVIMIGLSGISLKGQASVGSIAIVWTNLKRLWNLPKEKELELAITKAEAWVKEVWDPEELRNLEQIEIDTQAQADEELLREGVERARTPLETKLLEIKMIQKMREYKQTGAEEIVGNGQLNQAIEKLERLASYMELKAKSSEAMAANLSSIKASVNEKVDRRRLYIDNEEIRKKSVIKQQGVRALGVVALAYIVQVALKRFAPIPI